jgi:Ca2+-transporting ATPase
MANPFSNLKLVGTTALVIGLQVMIVQLPFFEPLFHTVPLDLVSWEIIILFSLIGLVISPLFFKKPEKAAT